VLVSRLGSSRTSQHYHSREDHLMLVRKVFGDESWGRGTSGGGESEEGWVSRFPDSCPSSVLEGQHTVSYDLSHMTHAGGE
jgi:hypothetical protein